MCARITGVYPAQITSNEMDGVFLTIPQLGGLKWEGGGTENCGYQCLLAVRIKTLVSMCSCFFTCARFAHG